MSGARSGTIARNAASGGAELRDTDRSARLASPVEAGALSSLQVAQLRVGPAVWAGGHPFGERPQCHIPSHAARPLAFVPAAARVDVHRHGVPVEAELQQPVGRGRPGLVAALPFRLAAFLVGDPPAGALEVGDLDAFEEAEEVETGRLVVHVFDSMMVAMPSNQSPNRYHLLLTSGGRPVQHGWWESEATAQDKFRRWIGEHGALPDARVTLTDEDTGETLTTWPDEA
jgi:hypothetical protein